MATLYTQQDVNIRKTWVLMGTFLVLVIALGYAASYYFGSPLILYAAVGFALVMNITSYWYSDKLVLRMTGAKPADPVLHQDLINIVENLAITAGLPMPRVYVVDDPAPNAFATGRDPDHAVVAATTGLLHILDRTELEGVMAHEMAHVGNRDMLIMTVAVVLAGFVAILSDLFMRFILYGGNSNRERHPAMLIIGFIGIILAPLAAKLIQTAVSRKREYLADATGALLTRYPEGLASALEKISGYGAPMRRANNATAHLFISDPFGGAGQRSFLTKLSHMFSTHPPVEKRIAYLRGMQQ